MWRLTIYQTKKSSYTEHADGTPYEFTESVTFRSSKFGDLVDLVVTANAVNQDDTVRYEIVKESEENA